METWCTYFAGSKMNVEASQPLIFQAEIIKPEAKLPQRLTSFSLGYDCVCTQTLNLLPYQPTVVELGIKLKMPKGFGMQILARSSFAKLGLSILGGLLDTDFEGEIKAIVVNTNASNPIHIPKGYRFIQLVPIQRHDALFVQANGVGALYSNNFLHVQILILKI